MAFNLHRPDVLLMSRLGLQIWGKTLRGKGPLTPPAQEVDDIYPQDITGEGHPDRVVKEVYFQLLPSPILSNVTKFREHSGGVEHFYHVVP